jgi:hypothetical protein
MADGICTGSRAQKSCAAVYHRQLRGGGAYAAVRLLLTGKPPDG